MNEPQVQILLAVYNGEKFLSAFLESLLKQSIDDFRLIVSDNKSTDRTAAILRSYQDRFPGGVVLLSPPSATVSAHLNFARVTAAASAPYVMYADADDVWRSDKVEKTLNAMRDAERNFGTDTPILVHSDLAVVDHDLRSLSSSYWNYHHVDPHRTKLNQILMQNCVTGCTAMLNRSLVDLGSPLPLESFVHDYWFALVASAFGKIIEIDEPLIEYRQHGSNVTGAKRWSWRYILFRAGSLISPSGPRHLLNRNIAQAGAMMMRYGDRLTQTERDMLHAFVTLRQAGPVARRARLFRYGFWKFGFVRNLGLFLAI